MARLILSESQSELTFLPLFHLALAYVLEQSHGVCSSPSLPDQVLWQSFVYAESDKMEAL